MTNTSTRSGAAANIGRTSLANTIGWIGSAFLTGLQHLYAAHTEKVQMRFAPEPIYSGRAGGRRRRV